MPSRLAPIALAATLSLVRPCSALPALSGEWESSLALEPVTAVWSTDSDVTIKWKSDAWTMSSRSIFDDGAWKRQQFDVETAINGLVIESDLRFEPYKNRFQNWVTQIEWEDGPLNLTFTSKLTRTTDWLIFEFEREWDMIEFDASFRLRAPTDSCSLSFYDASLELAFDACDIETDLEIAIDAAGFDEFVLEWSDLIVPRLPWIQLDLEFTRTMKTTSVKISPSVTLETPWCASCLELEIEGDMRNAPSFLPLAITEANLTWEMDDWDFEATAILDPGKWISKLYWLELQADTDFDVAPCGEVALELAFLWTEVEWGQSSFSFAYQPCSAITVTMESDVDLLQKRLDRLACTVEFQW